MAKFFLKLKWLLLPLGAFLASLLFRSKPKKAAYSAEEFKEAKQGAVDEKRKKQEAEADREEAAANAGSLDDWVKSELNQGGDEPPSG